MAELTNLTDRLSHLRDRKGGSPIIRGANPEPRPPPDKQAKARKPSTERKFAPDFFVFFVYVLLTVSLAAQLFLVVWLDFV